jgi:hypothetical protein
MTQNNRTATAASRRRERMLDVAVDDARETLAARFIDQIENLLATDDHRWAELTLRGIIATVEHTGRVTVGQRIAVAKIATAPKPVSALRWSGRRWY